MKQVIMIRSNHISHDPRVKKEAITLANNGFKVSILGRDKENKYQKYEKFDKYDIYRFNYKIGRYSLATFKTIFLPFSILIWWIYEFIFLFKNEWDIVHSCDFDTLIPAILVAKIKKKKLVYDIFDVYGDMITSTNIPNPLLNMLKFLEEFSIRFADVTILADISRKNQLKNAEFKKMVIIMNTPKSEVNSSLKNDNDEFIIFYGGLIAKERGLLQMIKAITDILDIKLIIAGYGYDEAELIPIFEKEKNIEFLGRVSHHKILECTKNADLLFALYDPTIPNNKYASPNKLFEAMLCEKPVIVNEGTSMADIVKEEKCGIIVHYDDIKEIKDAVVAIKNDKKLKITLGKNSRKAYDNKYNWSIMEKRLKNIYREL
jgi:glycosyltransferase involved in cell wall biosynthesis